MEIGGYNKQAKVEGANINTRSFSSATSYTAPYRKLAVLFISLSIFFSLFPVLRLPGVFFTLSDGFLFIGAFILFLTQDRLKSVVSSRAVHALWYLGIVCISAGFCISSIINGDPLRGLLVIMQYIFAYLFFPLVMILLNKQEIISVARYFLFGVAAVCFSGIVLYYFLPSIGSNYMVGGRMGSFLENANDFGKMIALSIPLWLYIWFTNNLNKILMMLFLVCSIVGLLISSSVSAILLSLTGLVLFFIFNLKLKLIMKFLTVLLCVVSISYIFNFELPKVFDSRILSLLESRDLNQAGTLVQKMDLAREAWNIIEYQPIIGVGADKFREYSIYNTPVHNTYLLLWVEGGLFAIVGWGILLAIMLVFSLKTWSKKHLRMASVAGTVTTLLFIASCLTNTHPYARFWVVPIFISLIVIAHELTENPKVKTSKFMKSRNKMYEPSTR